MKVVRGPLAWPLCTVPGCGHGHTWRDADEMHMAALSSGIHYVTDDNQATCKCHEDITDRIKFPCDVSLGIQP